MRTLLGMTPGLAAALMAACGVPTSASDLHPGGPPMIEQVRLTEVYSVGGVGAERQVFAFGSHPMAGVVDAHPVSMAKASGNSLRIIIDEPLRGAALEEISCRFVVDDDAFDRVPAGATPDDLARCAVPQAELASRCPGANPMSVCVCKNDGGCPSGDGVTPRGQSVGVLDQDQDGAPDRLRFIAGAVTITCGGIEVATDPDRSFWTPAGNQQQAAGGFDALGPAVVVSPRVGLPTGATCGVTFAPDVVDLDGNRVCAPAGGELARGCTPGDTSAVAFTVEPLLLTLEEPVTDPGQPRTQDIVIKAVAPLDPSSLAEITVTEAPATRYTQFTATLTNPATITFHWTAPGGLAAGTRYTIVVPTTVTDTYHQPAQQPLSIAFTTGAR